MALSAEPAIEIPYGLISFFNPLILKSKYIKKPLAKLWAEEIKKNGENRVPLISEVAVDFRNKSRKNALKLSANESKITVFESPSLKKGNILGRSSSAYEKSRVKETK